MMRTKLNTAREIARGGRNSRNRYRFSTLAMGLAYSKPAGAKTRLRPGETGGTVYRPRRGGWQTSVPLDPFVRKASPMTLKELILSLESTLLSPTASEAQVRALCREAAETGFFGVCVAPCRADFALGLLSGTSVRVASVAGFPLGIQTSRAKVAEVAELLEMGVHEVDLVFNIGFFLEGRISPVSNELREARRAAGDGVLKVILETGFLSPSQIREAAALALGAGADFLKTSTGLGPAGARIPDVRILRQVAGSRCGVKAAGGIRSLEQAHALLAAGANRIGTSSAAALWKEAQEKIGG
jgi:deoxyribose-phosphate aldolase